MDDPLIHNCWLKGEERPERFLDGVLGASAEEWDELAKEIRDSQPLKPHDT